MARAGQIPAFLFAGETYGKVALPLAGLYAVFLYGSNAAYAYLPVGYIQVLKVSQAVVALGPAS